jgi:outer membrane immunogenic protein
MMVYAPKFLPAMRRDLFAGITIAAIAAAGPAGAVDPSFPKTPRATNVSYYSWTTCYVGGYVNGAWDHSGVTFTDLGNANFPSFSGGAVAARVLPSHSWSAGLNERFFAGGTLGCNWQPYRLPFVLGAEGELGQLRLSGQAFDPATRLGTQTAFDVLGSAKIGDTYGTATARLGYASDHVLLYVKGGAAFVPVQASVTDSCATSGCGNWMVFANSAGRLVTTWTVGGGLEWAFAANWSVKAEYMFIGLTRTLTNCSNAGTTSRTLVPGGLFCFNEQLDAINTAKIGVNYRFW